jgi:hypothetical protein
MDDYLGQAEIDKFKCGIDPERGDLVYASRSGEVEDARTAYKNESWDYLIDNDPDYPWFIAAKVLVNCLIIDTKSN